MGQPSAPQKRPPFTRLHAVIVLASIMFVATVASFFSNDVEATRNIEQQAQSIPFNDQALSQIHTSITKENKAEDNNKALEVVTAELPTEQATPALKHSIIKVKSGHSLSTIFRKHRFSHQDLYRIMQKGKISKTLRRLQPGRTLEIESDEQGKLYSLSYQINRLQSINVLRADDDFDIEVINKPVEKRINFSSGLIQSSLFEAGKQSGLSDALVMEMAGIFGWDIDFALDIRQGDKFSILYEEQFIV